MAKNLSQEEEREKQNAEIGDQVLTASRTNLFQRLAARFGFGIRKPDPKKKQSSFTLIKKPTPEQLLTRDTKQEIDLIIFLRDPLTSQAHETDIQALIRLCDVYHVPIATNLASAEIFIKALDRGEFSFRDVRKTESQRI